MNNIIKINNENVDLLNDLITYRTYPYISFKDIKENGFVFSSDLTLDGVRKVSMNNPKKLDNIQTRIFSQDMLVNIVGFVILNNDDYLDCIDLKSFIDIGKNNTQPLPMIKSLIEYKIKNIFFKNNKNLDESTKLKNNYYWFFDLSKQVYNIPFYDISESMPKNDITKIVTSYLYDYVIEMVLMTFKDLILNSPLKSLNYNVDEFEIYKHLFEDMKNSQYSKQVNELEKIIYKEKSVKVTDFYDYNADKFPDNESGKLVILPTYKSNKKILPIIKFIADFIDFSSADEPIYKKKIYKDFEIDQSDYNLVEKIYLDGTCQHTISWNKISELIRNTKVNYSTYIYEFIQQFVDITADQDFICKSCKCSINLKKFILDGIFDNSLQYYVLFSTKMDVYIEDLEEYEKYKTSIKQIEKIIERMASIFNLQGLQGTLYSVKTKRRAILKDVIDIVINNNVNLKKNYIPNRDKYVEKYGVNKNLSNLFSFELDNSIFIYSSKDKDFYKIVKYNNVITYILIFLIIEINDAQISSLNNDKICNYIIYKKIGYSLFSGLKIIINKAHDVDDINNYPVLCYLIYLTSCFLTRYNIWGDTITDSQVVEKKKFNPLIQKCIINTLVELLNSILTVNIEEAKAKKIYIYEVFQTKYYFKINLFKDFKVIKQLDKMYLQDLSKKYIEIKLEKESKFDIIPNNEIFISFFDDDLFIRLSRKFTLQRYLPPLVIPRNIHMQKISNLSNCIGGEFHDFEEKDKQFICKICNEEANPDKFIPESQKLLDKRYRILYLRKLATKYCVSGELHHFEMNDKGIRNCIKCGYKENYPVTLNDSQLYNMFNNIEKIKKTNNLFVDKIVKDMKIKNNDDLKNVKKIFEKIMYKFQKNDNNINKSIELLLDIIQKHLGIDILVNDENYNLFYNIYYIDHDYNGLKLEVPIQIYEKENKFRIVEKHPFFKKDVLIYTIQKNTKYEMFYDLQEKNLLGYREVNKEFIRMDRSINKLKINYSIKNMLLLFGLPRQQISIKDYYPEIYGMTEDEINRIFHDKLLFTMNDFIEKIENRRFNSLKKLGYELNKYVNRFKYNYKVKLIHIENYHNYTNNKNNDLDIILNNPLDILYNHYKKKLDENIKTESEEKGEKKIFMKYMNTIINYMPYNYKINNNNNNNQQKFSEIIDYNYIIKNDFTSNLVLNYITDEIIRLINNNNSKITKNNLTHFIVDVIVILFNNIFFETSKFSTNLNYFYQILYTSEFYLETQTKDLTVDALDYYANENTLEQVENMSPEDQERVINQMEDEYEEVAALDIDEILDEEGRFDLYSNYKYIDFIKEAYSDNMLPTNL